MKNNSIVNRKKLWEVTFWDQKFQGLENFKQEKIAKISYMTTENLRNIFISDLFDPLNSNVRILSAAKFDGYTSLEKAGKYLQNGEVIAFPRSCFSNIKYHSGYFVTANNRFCQSIDKNLLCTKYLYHYLIQKSEKIKSFYLGSAIKNANMKSILEMEIFFPSIEKQKEIVNILDKFDELTRELTNRKKQYKYYMNYLINSNFNNIKKIWEVTFWDRKFQEVENYKQKESFKIPYMTAKNLKDIFLNNFSDENKYNVRILSAANFDGYTSIEKAGKYLQYGEVISICPVRYTNIKYHNGYFVTSENRICKSFDENILSTKYLYYYFLAKNEKIQALYYGSTFPTIKMKQFLEMEINIPSIKKQKEIVKILDKFENLISNLNEGLPKEIELVQKKYEYYRAKLLNFERA
ncbi:MAG: restriction endonuclease subunit S [Mycoplasmoidaceae bacterium]